MDPAELIQKRKAVERLLRGYRRVLVAFSGGVDSTVLAKLARDTLGKADVVAVTADSPSLARNDLHDATRLAAHLDLDHVIIATKEVEDATYRANTRGRCYICKGTLFDELAELALARDIPAVLYGAIGDDLNDERPGHQAARERRVRAPLQEAGLAKWDVRELARCLGLPNWDRPQDACLASRVPHGSEVTEDKLKQIEAAEAFLRTQGFRQVRVRHLGAGARVEVEPEAVARFTDVALLSETEAVLRSLGFEDVVIDPLGYRPGGANIPLRKGMGVREGQAPFL